MKELHEGIGGHGQIIWLVVTVGQNGRWTWIEYFDNKPEAICWLEWA